MKYLPARYVLAVLGGICFAIIYGLKVNLSVAIVAMVNHTASGGGHHDSGGGDGEGECEAPDSAGSHTQEDGPFDWSDKMQGIILGSYFGGYLISEVPGGRIAEEYSAKWVLFFAVAINVFGTVLTPVSAYMHFSLLLVMRVLEGIGGGVTFPAMHVMLAKWAPPQERFVISSIVYAGTALGTVISMVMAGALVAWMGWESVFYVMGALASIWLLLWAVLIEDTPQKTKSWLITQEEKEFIQSSLGHSDVEHKVSICTAYLSQPIADGVLAHPSLVLEVVQTRGKDFSSWMSSPTVTTEPRDTLPLDHIESPPVPWAKVFTSAPFLAILVVHTGCNWGWYLLLTKLPTYMSTILKFPIKENAGLSAMPFLCHWVFSMFYSKILDLCRAKGIITLTHARKLSTIIATVIPGLALIGVGFVGCDKTLAVLLMTVSITAIGAMYSGYLSNHLDIAPNYAGTLMGITNMVAAIPGCVVPLFVGYMTEGQQTVGQWRIIFYITAGLYALVVIIYTIFASGEEQSWNKKAEA